MKLKDGANLGDALKKLPGMEIRKKKLYYMGKPVDRLLVNGFDFRATTPRWRSKPCRPTSSRV